MRANLRADGYWYVENENHEALASIMRIPGFDCEAETANLFAAAPDMAEAIINLLREFDEEKFAGTAAEARAALKKAGVV